MRNNYATSHVGRPNIKFICNDHHLKETNMRQILNNFCPPLYLFGTLLLSDFANLTLTLNDLTVNLEGT